MFAYDGTKLIGEYNVSGVMLRRYVHGPGVDEPVVWLEGAGFTTPRYFIQNYQGSIIAYTNATGTLNELYKYGPYGEPKNVSNADSWTGSRFRYTGQTRLDSGELYYYKARVYDPKHGRFLQTDPIGSKDDLDLYAYTAGDPINKTDPDGQIANFIVSAVVGAVVGGGIDYGIQVAENLANGKDLKTAATDVDLGSVGTSAVVGALTATLGPTGALLGKGGNKAVKYGFSKSAGLFNKGHTRFGWSTNSKGQTTLRRSVGEGKNTKHFPKDGPGIKGNANPTRDGAVAGAVGGGAKQVVDPDKKN